VTTADEGSPLERYVARRGTGDLAGALSAAREACAAEPNAAPPRYALGEAQTALGDDAGAVQAFADALRRAPGWADAWVNLGLALYRQGGMAAAKMAMREALKQAPGHTAATTNLAAFMRITGEAEAAEVMLRDSLSRAPEAVGARLNLAAELLQRGLGGEALALLDAAPAEAASLRAWHLARTSALLQLGRTAAVRAALAALEALGPVPPDLAPLVHLRHMLLAQLEGDAPRAQAAAAQAAAAIPEMGPNAVPEHRIMAHYDLAKFWSEQGDRPAAFAQWQAGHALLRVSQPFFRDRFLAFVEATIASFPAARFAQGPRAGNRDPAPVFITGMPRSGTTLCEQILAAHGQVHGAGERTALGRMADSLGGPLGITALDAAALDAAAADYLAELHALAPDKARIVDKMPGNELNLGLVGLMLPGARIIHCVRDPRDIGLSIWTFRFHGEHPYAHDLGDLGWTIAQRARLTDHWRAVLPNPILTIALHDWVRDFDGTLARVLAHLDLPPDPACARFYEIERDVRTVSREQVRQPVHSKGLGRWRGYAAELAPLIVELDAAGMLAAWDTAATATAAGEGRSVSRRALMTETPSFAVTGSQSWATPRACQPWRALPW
jgi:tetratricopeptide (TPR) repeat protein